MSAAPTSTAASVSGRVKEAVLKGLLEKAKEEQGQHERTPNKLWPSGIGRCLRAQYYSYLYPEVFDARKLSIFATGKAIHLYLPEIIQTGGMEVKATELPVRIRHPEKDLYISGRVDVLIVSDGREDVVVEIKSTKKLPTEPHRQHVLQLQCYLNHLGLRRGVILYWDKSAGHVEAFEITVDPSCMEEIWRRCEAVCESIVKRSPPPREGAENGWECLFCEHFLRCYVGVGGEELKKPLVVAERDVYDLITQKQVVEKMHRAVVEEERAVVVLSDNPNSSIEELLLERGVPFTSVIKRPAAYDPARWGEKVAAELSTVGGEFATRASAVVKP